MADISLHTRIVVDDGHAALDFYATVFDTTPVEVHTDAGRILHAEVPVGDDVLALTQGDGATNRSPTDLGGSPVLLTARVPDADALATRMVEAGAEVIFPVADRDYGRRDGRLRDPHGHLWLVTQLLDGAS